MAENTNDFHFQQTAEVIQQRLNQVPVNTQAIEQESAARQEADSQEAAARQEAIQHEAQVRQQADEHLQSEIDMKQNQLTFDNEPRQNSDNPVKSGGIKTAIDQMGATKQDTLTFDDHPTAGSSHPVTSGGVKSAIDAEEQRARLVEESLASTKQNVLHFDNVPTQDSLNPVTSGGIAQAIRDFITKSVNDLANYYLKSDTYNRTEVQQLIDAVKQFTYEKVATLPTASALTMNKIYLVPSPVQVGQNVSDEFITIATEQGGSTRYDWEQIGSTTIDLSGYSTTAEMNAAINTALAVYSTTEQMNAAIAQALTNHYTKAEIDAALAQKQNLLTFDTTPTAASLNPVTSGGIKAALDALYAQKQNQLTFDQVPTAESLNPVTSGGIAQAIANFITASVDNLLNYYTKAQTYSRTEIQQLIHDISQFDYKVVGALPTPSASTMHTIYLAPSSNPKTQNEKDEFITIMTEREVEGQVVTVYVWEQIGSTTIDLSDYSTTAEMNAAINAAAQDIMALIPQDATALNQLADKNWVAEQIAENAGTFRGTFASVEELEATTGNHNNDYAFVVVTDQDGDNDYDRYKFNGTQWVFEYRLNNTHFTAAELAAIRSGITAALVSKLNALPTATELQTALNARYTKSEADTLLAGKQAAITDGAQIGLGFGVSSEAATVQARTATIASFILLKNMPVSIRFTNAINVVGATLNISSTGAKPIYIGGNALQPGVIRPGMVATMIYDGTNWNIVALQGLEQSAGRTDYMVDMGLPSGLLWADRNIDATQPDGFCESPFQYEGSFFSWGNTEPHNPTSTSAFGYDWGSNNDGPYASTPGAKLNGNMAPSQDIVRAICGAPFRLPTTDEFAELFANIDYVQADGETVIDASQANKLVTVNSIVGIYLKSKINGKLLFFPCSGYGYGSSWSNRGSYGGYWSSSLYSATGGRDLLFLSGGVYPQDSSTRFSGFAGRAVQ